MTEKQRKNTERGSPPLQAPPDGGAYIRLPDGSLVPDDGRALVDQTPAKGERE